MAAISEDDKKKLYVLGGLLAALAVVFAVVYLPGMLSGGDSAEPVAEAPVAPATETVPPPGDAPPPGGETPPAEGSAPVAQAAGFSLVAAENARPDPFVPFYRRIEAAPPPAPPRTRVVQRRVREVPPPLDLPLPQFFMGGGGSMGGGNSMGGGSMNLPPMGLPSSPSNRVAPAGASALFNLPPARISYVSSQPDQPNAARINPPARAASEIVDPNTIRESTNKRLSGVIIGDGIRAILEISTGDAAGGGAPGGGAEGADAAPTTITRVVQPGDVVEGIRIVRIERYREGNRTGTRMLINEDGQNRYVELKPLPVQQEGGAAGAAPGALPRRGALPGNGFVAQRGGAQPRGGIGPRGRSPRSGSGVSGWGPPAPP